MTTQTMNCAAQCAPVHTSNNLEMDFVTQQVQFNSIQQTLYNVNFPQTEKLVQLYKNSCYTHIYYRIWACNQVPIIAKFHLSTYTTCTYRESTMLKTLYIKNKPFFFAILVDSHTYIYRQNHTNIIDAITTLTLIQLVVIYF